jgi:Ca2+-binding EF-hand superfamily protein
LFITTIAVIFKVYDSDRNGKVSFKDILEVLKDLSGSYMSDEQREVSSNNYMLLYRV